MRKRNDYDFSDNPSIRDDNNLFDVFEVTGEIFHMSGGVDYLVPNEQDHRYRKDEILLFEDSLYSVTGQVMVCNPLAPSTYIVKKLN